MPAAPSRARSSALAYEALGIAVADRGGAEVAGAARGCAGLEPRGVGRAPGRAAARRSAAARARRGRRALRPAPERARAGAARARAGVPRARRARAARDSAGDPRAGRGLDRGTGGLERLDADG